VPSVASGFTGGTSSGGTFTLAPGTYGVAIEHLPVIIGANVGAVIHPLYTNPAIAPTTTTFSNQHMTLSNPATQGLAFTGGVASPRVPNTAITDSTPAPSAYWCNFGAAAYDRKQSFYEAFPAPGTIDLTGPGVTG